MHLGLRAASRRANVSRRAFAVFSIVLVSLLAACGTSELEPASTITAFIPIEAEFANVAADFATGFDDSASNQEFLMQQADTVLGTGGSEEAWIDVTVPTSGEYTLWARLRADRKDGDATYLGFNQTTRRVFPVTLGEYVWLEIDTYYLMPGDHRISIGSGEPGVRLDLMVVTNIEALTSYDLSTWFASYDPADPAVTPPGDPDPTPPTQPAPKPPAGSPPGTRTWMSLRGDPSFERSSLSSDARLWYDRLWAAIGNPDAVVDIEAVSKSDDAYAYAREVSMHNHALLLALRATGDLRFLDEVDVLAQNMRANLSDGWCGGVSSTLSKPGYGTIHAKDGYLNFRRRGGGDSGTEPYCRDTADLEETLLHGQLSLVMYAYHVNRDLKSPAGVDYGERADFWLDYLQNHFEEKWRERSGTSYPDMDFISAKFCHTYGQFNLYYYYVGSTLEDLGDAQAQTYLSFAREMTDDMFEVRYQPGKRPGGFMTTSTPLGPAVVYSFGAPGQTINGDAVNMEACPTTYSRYMTAANLEMYFEGFHRWDDDIMSKIANGYAHFVMDTSSLKSRSEPFAAGVTGSKTVEGIPATTYRDRISVYRYAVSTIALLGLWDGSGKIDDINAQAFDNTESSPNTPDRVQLPASFLVRAVIDSAQ